MLYIEFTIQDYKKFNDFLKIFENIKNINKIGVDVEFWEKLFPDYSKGHFNLMEYYDEGHDDKKTDFEYILRFLYNFDVTYHNCKEISDGIGRLEFSANSFPFGTSSEWFYLLKTFDLKSTKVNWGFDDYIITWTGDFEFEYEKREQ